MPVAPLCVMCVCKAYFVSLVYRSSDKVELFLVKVEFLGWGEKNNFLRLPWMDGVSWEALLIM